MIQFRPNKSNKYDIVTYPLYYEKSEDNKIVSVLYDDVISTDQYNTVDELVGDLQTHKKKIENGRLIDGTTEEVMSYAQAIAAAAKRAQLEELRYKRKDVCFSVINRGRFWYDGLTERQFEDLQNWYRAWLDVTVTMVEPAKPSWLN